MMTTLTHLPTTGSTPLTQPGARSHTSRRAGGYPAPLSVPAWTAGRSPRRQPIAAGLVAGACRLIPTNTPTRGGSVHVKGSGHSLISAIHQMGGGRTVPLSLEHRPLAVILLAPQPRRLFDPQRKDTPMQSVGITTHLRDLWDDVSDDNIIDLREQQALESLIVAADDSVRLSLTILKVGDGSRDTRQRIREHTRLHGPIDLERARRQRRPIDLGKVRNAKRSNRGNGPSAA